MKRDESRDVAVRWDWDYSETSDETWTFPADDCCSWGHPDQSPNAERYVPFAQLETERGVLRDVKREAAEIIAGLRAELAELKAREAKKAKEVFYPQDTDGPHVLAAAYLQYECVLCGETLYPDGSDEPIDGLESDLNGFTVSCKCGAEYVGSTPETASLYLLRDEEKEAP